MGCPTSTIKNQLALGQAMTLTARLLSDATTKDALAQDDDPCACGVRRVPRHKMDLVGVSTLIQACTEPPPALFRRGAFRMAEDMAFVRKHALAVVFMASVD